MGYIIKKNPDSKMHNAFPVLKIHGPTVMVSEKYPL